MINWNKTSKKFGYSSSKELVGLKRPKVICLCDDCEKERIITIRVKSKIINNQMKWLCPACVSLNRSKEISNQMLKTWKKMDYRKNQLTKKNLNEYKTAASKSSIQRWEDPNYRKQLETGINTKIFLNKCNKKFENRFKYDSSSFTNWKNPIHITCNICKTNFWKNPLNHFINGSCPKCQISSGQREISNFIDSLGAKSVLNDRNVLSGYELDILVPTHNFAIEYHGVFWHSYNRVESKKEKYRHQRKAIQSIDNNIKLLQFFDFEWDHKQKIIKSMIQNALGMSKKYDARKLKIKQLDNKTAQKFFQQNHLQGHRFASLTLALTNKEEIIIATSFSRHKNGHELIRFATKCGITVRGGANLRYSHGNVYKQLGFKHIGITPPGYFYTKQHYKNYTILSRQQCQKHKLHKLLGPAFKQELTETENMFNNGYRRVWTAGNLNFSI